MPSFGLPPSPTLGRLVDPAVREQALAVLERTGIRYNQEQLEFILAPSTVTAVTAGAGSGKTATMVGRVVVMMRVLGVDPDDIQVISFTRKSADEFRERLARALIRVDGNDDSDADQLARRAGQLKDTVSTFHSAALRQARRLGLVERENQLFEFAGKDDDEDDERNTPTLDTKITPVMMEVLREAYWRAHREVPGFADQAREMEAEEDRQRWYAVRKGQEPHALKMVNRWNQFNEREYLYQRSDLRIDDLGDVTTDHRRDPWRQLVADRLASSGVNAAHQVAFRVMPPSELASRAGRHLMYASFKVGDLHLHVERHFLAEVRKRRTKHDLSFHERDRRIVISQCSENPNTHHFLLAQDFARRDDRWVLTPKAEQRLMDWLDLPGSVPMDSGPGPAIKLTGGLRQTPLPELLFNEGTFIEAQAIRVEDLPVPQALGRKLESLFVQMLQRYWPVLAETIRQRGYIRFGSMLGDLRAAGRLQPLADKLPRHLLVDEFQDISLELLLWVRRWLEAVVSDLHETSITAIGDQWQAIYSWRGSHPLFLEQFHHFFPSSSSAVLTLRTNYRSRQDIIDLGEAVLQRSPQEIKRRHGLSAITEAPTWARAVGFGTAIRRRPDVGQDGGDTQAAVQQAVVQLQRLAASIPAQLFGRDDEPIVVYELRRSVNDGGIRMSDQLRRMTSQFLEEGAHPELRNRRVSAQRLTFHRAKGLEAHFVVVVGDSFFVGQHPLRDHVLRSATQVWQRDFPILAHLGSYTAVGEDEVQRLMYVALTRAKLGVLWVPVAGEDGQLSSGGCFQSAARWAGQEPSPPRSGARGSQS